LKSTCPELELRAAAAGTTTVVLATTRDRAAALMDEIFPLTSTRLDDGPGAEAADVVDEGDTGEGDVEFPQAVVKTRAARTSAAAIVVPGDRIIGLCLPSEMRRAASPMATTTVRHKWGRKRRPQI
jgi:hypothetical protein